MNFDVRRIIIYDPLEVYRISLLIHFSAQYFEKAIRIAAKKKKVEIPKSRKRKTSLTYEPLQQSTDIYVQTNTMFA